MAKAKSGGTRALIRGRVASDVYSIGKDGSGRRTQVVRSAPEEVANPKTQSQVEQRVKMKAVAKACGLMSAIINHSWEGVGYGQPSVSEFMKRSMIAINADIAANPSQNKSFLFPAEGDVNPTVGLFPVSAGSLIKPESVVNDALGIEIVTTVASADVATMTVGDLRAALGVADGDYITYLKLVADGANGLRFEYCRFYFEPGVPDTTLVTADNLAGLFRTEGTFVPQFSIDSTGAQVKIRLRLSAALVAEVTNTVSNVSAVILSQFVEGSWRRCDAALEAVEFGGTPAGTLGDGYIEQGGYPWPDVLDEWTIGVRRFLNGGTSSATEAGTAIPSGAIQVYDNAHTLVTVVGFAPVMIGEDSFTGLKCLDGSVYPLLSDDSYHQSYGKYFKRPNGTSVAQASNGVWADKAETAPDPTKWIEMGDQGTPVNGAPLQGWLVQATGNIHVIMDE